MSKANKLEEGTMRVRDLLKSLNHAKKLLSEVMKLANILIVAPATNAISERSFSASKRVKTYLRSTMGDKQLNHLMLIHIHRETADNMKLVDVANQFVGGQRCQEKMLCKFP